MGPPWRINHGVHEFVTGYWLLVTGYWLLVTGYWLLVTGYWLLGGAEEWLYRK